MTANALDEFKTRHQGTLVSPILGMHHSGMSLVAKLLSQMGIGFFGDNQPEGATETCFQSFNTQLLKIAGCDSSGFDAPKKILAVVDRCRRITIEDYRKSQLRDFIDTTFLMEPWGWDDPRTVLTFDFWNRTLKELGFENVRPIIVIREPRDVIGLMTSEVRGEAARIPSDQLQRMAAEIWLAYARVLWRYCCCHTWEVVTFESLSDASNLELQLARMTRYLGLDVSRIDLARKSGPNDSFPQPDQVPEQESSVFAEADRIYLQFKRLALMGRVHLTETAMDSDESRLLGKAQRLKDLGRIETAVDLLSKALNLRPQYRAARFMLSYTLMETGHIVQSFQHADWLVESIPDDPVGHGLRAFGLTQQARIDEAIQSFRKSLSIRERNNVAWSNLLFSSLYSDSLTATEVKELHVEGSAAITQMLSTTPTLGPPQTPVSSDLQNRRLRIGYLSADLKKHPVGYFLRSLLLHHDSEQFEVFCYHTSPAQDSLTAILKRLCDNWYSVHGLDDLQLTERIRSDQLDILIDLSGHSSGNRCGVIIHRAAPVQAMYLGYPATSGIPEMDFIIADRTLIPPEFESNYTEKVAHLDQCFLCFHPHEDAPDVAPAPCEANGFVTFGSFNNLPKISYSTVVLWAKLLKAVPTSRLVIKALSLVCSGTRELFTRQFIEQGIDPSRVDLLPPTVPLSKFLEEYRRIDIGLDPIPFNGGTTTCEALWMGVPVITLVGTTFCGRMGQSILSTLGQEDWVAHSSSDYIRKAVDLAAQPKLISRHRQQLRGRMLKSPLCDGKRFTLGFENCCREMVTWSINQASNRTIS